MTTKHLNFNKDANKAFNEYISKAIQHIRNIRSDSYDMLACKSGMSEDFIRNALSLAEPQHFNAYHIYLIACAEHVSVNDIYPPIYYSPDNTEYSLDKIKKLNQKAFNKYVTITNDDSKSNFKDFIKKLKTGMQKEE